MQTRRIFLSFVGSSIAAGLTACTSSTEPDDLGEGTGSDSSDSSDSTGTQTEGETGDETGDDCVDYFAGGELLGVLPFIGESGVVGQKTGVGLGHDGKMNYDLAKLTPDTLITPNDEFYIRTEWPDQIDESEPWTITITGLVGDDYVLTMDELLAMDHVTEVVCLECSGNGGGSRFGLISAAEFSGVPLMDVLDLVDVDPSATMALVSGFDQHSHVSMWSTVGASWTFTFEQIAAAGGMLVTQMNGEPLPRDHGAPIRLLMPGWYGCCNAKWVDTIRLVDDTEPATTQQIEYAARTHQLGTPELAKDYAAATMHQAAMVTRVEKWRVDGEILYKLVGIMWGGATSTDKLAVEIAGVGGLPVEICPAQTQNRTWTLWTTPLKPPSTGQYIISLVVDDPDIPTRRLDSKYYARAVMIDEI